MHQLEDLGANPTLLDLSRYPQQLQLSWRYHRGSRSYLLATTGGDRLDLGQYRVIWWRRPQPYELHAQLSKSENRQFAYAEIYGAFTGMWNALDAYWINNPTNDDRAHRKVYQLRVAQDVACLPRRSLSPATPTRPAASLTGLA